MPIHIMLSGEALSYEQTPASSRFIEHVRAMVERAQASEEAVVALVYGADNPLLQHGVLLGRGLVTRAVIADPTWHVLLDLVDQARARAAAARAREAPTARATVSVADAAAQLRVSTSAVRQAIARGTLEAVKQGGTYWLTPEAVGAYRVSRTGPKARAKPPPAPTRGEWKVW